MKQGERIWSCSVCGRSNKIGALCEVCGFDRRKDFYEYPSVSKMDEKVTLRDYRIEYILKEKIDYMRPLAMKGDIRALFYLGAYYENIVVQDYYKNDELEKGVENLKIVAEKWLYKAAENGRLEVKEFLDWGKDWENFVKNRCSNLGAEEILDLENFILSKF